MPDNRVRFRDLLSTSSRVKYLLWTVLRRPFPVRLRTRYGTLLLRDGADFEVAYEIFITGVYDLLPLRGVHRVVDLGGNVGYSVLYWAARFPEARIEVWEPHPAHCRVLEYHLALNSLHERVQVVNAAAGAAGRSGLLSDERSASRLGAGPGGLRVEIRDFFAANAGRPIDVLKMDIEGGEWELLTDPRFLELRIRALALEWHLPAPVADPKAYCLDRLRALGLSPCLQEDYVDSGLLRATRSDGEASEASVP
jgi:FkbM family methyltransferase